MSTSLKRARNASADDLPAAKHAAVGGTSEAKPANHAKQTFTKAAVAEYATKIEELNETQDIAQWVAEDAPDDLNAKFEAVVAANEALEAIKAENKLRLDRAKAAYEEAMDAVPANVLSRAAPTERTLRVKDFILVSRAHKLKPQALTLGMLKKVVPAEVMNYIATYRNDHPAAPATYSVSIQRALAVPSRGGNTLRERSGEGDGAMGHVGGVIEDVAMDDVVQKDAVKTEDAPKVEEPQPAVATPAA